jgi:hypothetical protein
MRWVYARVGITTSTPGSAHHQQYQPLGPVQQQFNKQGALAFVHSDTGDTTNGSDNYLIESQLELTDYPSHSGSGGSSSSGGGSRDARSKGMHSHRV